MVTVSRSGKSWRCSRRTVTLPLSSVPDETPAPAQRLLHKKSSSVGVRQQETWARPFVPLQSWPSRGSPAPAHQIYIRRQDAPLGRRHRTATRRESSWGGERREEEFRLKEEVQTLGHHLLPEKVTCKTNVTMLTMTRMNVHIYIKCLWHVFIL